MLRIGRCASRSAWAALLLVTAVTAQSKDDASAEDWPKVVRTAVEHPRFALRRAAAGRIARAGDAAIPALRDYMQQQGARPVPLELVDAIGGAERLGPETRLLLDSWARDPSFYWRSQALDGLARHPTESTRVLCEAALRDPSYLYRIAGARGLVSSPLKPQRGEVAGLLDDPDPRARLRVALMLLEQHDDAGLAEIVAAFDRIDATFLDDSWGRREVMFAVRELQRIAKQDFGKALSDDQGDRTEARKALIAWAESLDPKLERLPAPEAVPAASGGIEVRSCQNGDLYLRWTSDGTVVEGLAPTHTASIDPADLATLTSQLGPLAGRKVHGHVICDYLRVFVPKADGHEEVHHKVAPDALPEPLAEWLKAFGRALEKGGSVNLERELEARLSQFAGARKE